MNILEANIIKSKVLAEYWIAMATTGATKSRDVYKGDKTPLTDEEKIQDALGIAMNHIHRIGDLIDLMDQGGT